MNWVCRMWTQTSVDGWISDFETFPSKEEANEMGMIHVSLLTKDELARDYEVYERR